jgi:hypothetical protein
MAMIEDWLAIPALQQLPINFAVVTRGRLPDACQQIPKILMVKDDGW